MLCVVFLVKHTDVSVSSLPVDTMELLLFKIVCGLVRNATHQSLAGQTELCALSLFDPTNVSVSSSSVDKGKKSEFSFAV